MLFTSEEANRNGGAAHATPFARFYVQRREKSTRPPGGGGELGERGEATCCWTGNAKARQKVWTPGGRLIVLRLSIGPARDEEINTLLMASQNLK